MKRSGCAAVVALVGLIGLGGAARAATVTVAPDKPTYLVGETVTLNVTSDSQGGSDSAIRGRLEYSSALTNTVTSTQTTHTTAGANWVPVPLTHGDGFADVFNQTRVLAATVDQLQIATATLVAEALGLVTVTWSTSFPTALDYFGVTSASGTSFQIVPEPATALLTFLGLAGIALAGRRSA